MNAERAISYVLIFLAFTGGATGLGNSAAIFFQLRSMQWQPTASPLMWYLLIANFCLVLGGVALFLYLGRRHTRLDRELAEQADKLSEAARFNKSATQAMHHLQSISTLQTGVTYYLESARDHNFDPKLVEKRFLTYVNQTVDKVREMLTYYTGGPCSVCVKLFIGRNPLEEQQEFPHNYIKTFCRDSASHRDRLKVDAKFDTKAFPYTQNTGFSRIIDSPDDLTYFYNNDLKALGQGYRNQNPNWSKYYNATAIAALKDPDQPKGSGIIAFLCVDNMEGRFDDYFCKNLLMLVSNNLFYAFTNAFMISRGRR